MKITKYHQSGFIIHSGDKCLAVDIGSLTPFEELPSLCGRTDAALVSHKHQDHCSLDHLKALTADVYTVADAAEMLKDPALTVHVHKTGDTVTIEGTPFVVTVFPSDHGPHISEPIENTALLISDGTHAVYFLGDMFNAAAPIAEPFDALLIPVGNGNYTFGPQEAAAFVREIGWDGLTIPMHYNPVQQTEHTADEFETLLGTEAIVRKLDIGESVDIA